jgi:uncharacterized membrane protein YfcA
VPGLIFLGILIWVAAGTDLAQMTVTAAIDTISWYARGYVDPVLDGLLTGKGIASTFTGAKLNNVLPTAVIKKVFAMLMFIIGMKMIFSTGFGWSL